MRLFINSIVILSFSLSGNLWSDNSESPWPLVPENMWLLEDVDHWYDPAKIRITDSSIIQGEKYYHIRLPFIHCSLFRIDSIGDTYTFTDNKDQLIFPFGSKDTNYNHFTFNDSVECWIKLSFPSDTTEIFPGLKGAPVISLFDYDTLMWDDETSVTFVTSVGPVQSCRAMAPGIYTIKGCVIDGKEYGVTMITNPGKPQFYQTVVPRNRFYKLNNISRNIDFSNGIFFTAQGRKVAGRSSASEGIYILRKIRN